MTHIFVCDLHEKEDDEILYTLEDFPLNTGWIDLVRESGCIASGSGVYTFGWGWDCPANNEGVHYGKDYCRRCGAR